MKTRHIIHTPAGKILAIDIKGSICQGVMVDSMQGGAYPPLHRIQFPADSVIEDVVREIKVKGERQP